MSYDLTIRGDERYSKSAPLASLRSFLSQQPGLSPIGPGDFVLDDRPKRWMEVDLEVVNEDGDNIQEPGQEYDQINCLRLHVPYAFLGEAIERDYIPTASAIAQHLGWELFDEQTGNVIGLGSSDPAKPSGGKPWWKIW